MFAIIDEIDFALADVDFHISSSFIHKDDVTHDRIVI